MKKVQECFNKIYMKDFTFVLAGVYICSLIPILCISIYNYPQADDWGYSYLTHWAWIDTHSLFQVLKAAAAAVVEAYNHWQGTFSSIFLMSLQPGIFGEQFYVFVPFIMLGLLSFSVIFFFLQISRFFNKSRYYAVIFSMFTLLLVVQHMISKPVAFFWYNAAVHYIVPFCFGLLLVACFIILYKERKLRWGALIGACIFSVMLGGGNLVTALSGIIGFVTLFVLLAFNKKKRMLLILIIPAVFNFLAFTINVVAPGNSLRQEATGIPGNPVMSILRSLFYGIYYLGDVWLDWQIILFVLLLIPFAWSFVQNIDFKFPFPLLFSLYSYGFLSAMFTPTDYAAHTAGIGRVQNVIFTAYIIVIALNVIYITGWVYQGREREKIKSCETGAIQGKSASFIWVLCAVALFSAVLTSIPSPERFTTALAIQELSSGSAKECGQIAFENIQILKNSTEESVTIWKVPKTSKLLTSDDIDQWHYDTKNYFRKKTVMVIDKK